MSYAIIGSGKVAKAAKSWQGKIVIDVTKAYGVPPEELGNLPSSVVISRALPGAKLVKAFNHLPAETLSRAGTQTIRLLACTVL
jgi:predicted dinucleotide-binding enzyme